MNTNILAALGRAGLLMGFLYLLGLLNGCGSAEATQLLTNQYPDDAYFCECLTDVDRNGEAYEYCPNCFDQPTRFTDVWCYEEAVMFDSAGEAPLAGVCSPYTR